MILQRYCNISDWHTEYQIPDRLRFRNFLGLARWDKIPDARSIRLFKDKLTKNHVTEQLYEVFNNDLYNKCLIINEGQIADAGFVEVPRRRNTKSENEQIKEGKGDELRNNRLDKKRRKAIDARRTKKNNETFYGYRRDNKIEGKSKFVKKYIVRGAEVHASHPAPDLLGRSDKERFFSSGSACISNPIDDALKKYEMRPQICEKGYRNHPLTEEQKKNNTEKSRFRSRAGHIFGFVENSMNGSYIRSTGFNRAKAIIGLMNLTCKLFRYERVIRLQLLAVNE